MKIDPQSDSMAVRIFSRLTLMDAEELEKDVLKNGWTEKNRLLAHSLALSIIDFFGPGDYVIYKHECWHEPVIMQDVEWLPEV